LIHIIKRKETKNDDKNTTIDINKIQITSIKNHRKRNKKLTKSPNIPICIQTRNKKHWLINKPTKKKKKK